MAAARMAGVVCGCPQGVNTGGNGVCPVGPSVEGAGGPCPL